VSAAWLSLFGALTLLSLAAGVGLARRGWRADPHPWRRATSPTMWGFAGYLLLAGLLVPHGPDESASPLVGLAAVLPLWMALSGLASAAPVRSAARIGAALLLGLGVVTSSALVLALVSPRFVPPAFR
jgi:hypothetical protein